MKRTFCVIDGNSLMYRAFFAVPKTMEAPDGRKTNALQGFLSMFVKMVERFNPDGVICAFDKGKPQVRIDMLPSYKAQRPHMDDELREQFPMIKEALQALNVPVAELEGWEGDDILGTIAKQGEALGYDMYLITGDRDMYQLSTDHIRIVSTHKGMSEIAVMTPESVEELYAGITPAQVPDFYGLKGDTSDNIPGVPGIGKKRAAELICTYGSLENLIDHADEIKGKMGENLRTHIEDALISKKVATIRTDAPLGIDLNEVQFPAFDAARFYELLTSFGMRSIRDRVLSLDASSSAVAPSFEIPAVTSCDAKLFEEICASDMWLGVAISKKQQASLFDSDLELYLATQENVFKVESEQSCELCLERLLKRGKISVIDLKACMHCLAPADEVKEELLDPETIATSELFDCQLAAYLLDSSKGEYTSPYLAELYLGTSAEKQLAPSDEAYVALLLHDLLEQKLKEDNSYELYRTIEMPLVGVLAHMERLGMYVDPAVLHTQSTALGERVAAMAQDIFDQAGEQFNIDSPKQLSHILFDVMELPVDGLKKTKTGYYSTNAKILDALSVDHKIVRDVLDYREASKIKSTYLDALPRLIAADGRIHTTFNQSIAATGRLTSSNPNLQNIPVRSDLGRAVRQAFSVGDGCVFFACDYSQIELRLLAHLSEDEHLIKAFCEGADFHAATAARVFGVSEAEVTPQLRSQAKAVNFGIVYGQQAFGLAQVLGISRPAAQAMIDRYFEAYPGVRKYLDDTVAFAKKNLWVATMFNRKRHVPDIQSRNFQLRSFAERTAMNHPMQGSAADIIKLAMVEVEKRLRKEKMRSKLILQIHDELDFEVPLEELDDLQKLVQETMESVVELRVPLLAEGSYGNTWADAK